MDSDTDDTSSEPSCEPSSEPVQKKEQKLKMCKVPGCGATVKRIWNHIHGVHKTLSGTFLLQLLGMVTLLIRIFSKA